LWTAGALACGLGPLDGNSSSALMCAICGEMVLVLNFGDFGNSGNFRSV
jgi:hypothetical protein